MNIRNIFTVGTLCTILTSCASNMKYNPNDFTAVPKIEKDTKIINAADSVNKASFEYIPDAAIMTAYKKYITDGKMDVVNTKGFIAYPFSADFQPIIPSQPLQAVDIELEPGEKIQPNGIAMGDTQRWTYAILTSYNDSKAVEHIIFKPKDWSIATNIIVGTNLRTYHFGLVSEKNADVKQIKFWYPEEMQEKANAYIAEHLGENNPASNSSKNKDAILDDVPGINIHNLNFSYSMFGDEPDWKPIRIFDDGVHTYIQFPPSIENNDMPVLYAYKNDDKELINYRAKGNYFVIDGVFPEMVLILGRPGYFFNLFDDRQQAVYIENNKLSK
ncbi:MAG: TrbG/VirB9 family P-type conjugative transfer protein [Lentisphaerota bacterium]